MDSTYPLVLEGSVIPLPAIPFSFETGEVWTALDLPVLPFRFKIVKAVAVATKAIAATDDGTVVLKKGSTTLATLTFTASAPINTAATATVADNKFEQTDQIRLATAKATAGGKGQLFLHVQVLPQI